jgi:hypothetical protein
MPRGGHRVGLLLEFDGRRRPTAELRRTGCAGKEVGRFVGEAAEGMIRCEAGPDGRLLRLEVAPEVLWRTPREWSAVAGYVAVPALWGERGVAR